MLSFTNEHTLPRTFEGRSWWNFGHVHTFDSQHLRIHRPLGPSRHIHVRLASAIFCLCASFFSRASQETPKTFQARLHKARRKPTCALGLEGLLLLLEQKGLQLLLLFGALGLHFCSVSPHGVASRRQGTLSWPVLLDIRPGLLLGLLFWPWAWLQALRPFPFWRVCSPAHFQACFWQQDVANLLDVSYKKKQPLLPPASGGKTEAQGWRQRPFHRISASPANSPSCTWQTNAGLRRRALGLSSGSPRMEKALLSLTMASRKLQFPTLKFGGAQKFCCLSSTLCGALVWVH